MSDIKIDLSGFSVLRQMLAGNMRVRVGIMANKASRNEAGGLKKGGGHTVKKASKADIDNATVGAKMEFGVFSENIPARSWLRMPLYTRQRQIMEKAGPYFKVAMTKKNPMLFWKIVGIAAEDQIMEAFKTQGWGSWKDNAPLTVALKGFNRPLIDTRQFERAVSSQVVKA